MFARLARYQVDPDRCEEALRAFDKAGGELRDIAGFEDGWVLVDGDEGRIYTLTLWTDRAAMEASEVRASRLRQEAVRSVDGDCEFVDRLNVAQELGDQPH